MKYICNWGLLSVAKLTEKLEKKYFSGMLFLLFLIICAAPIGVPLVLGPDQSAVMGCIGFFCSAMIFLLCLKKESMALRRYKLWYLVPTLILGLSFVIHGIAFGSLAYFAIGIFFFFFPFLHLSLGGNESAQPLLALSLATVGAFWLFFFASLLAGPKLIFASYASFLGNRNSLGNFLVVGVAAAIYLTHSTVGQKRGWTFFGLFTLCMMFVMGLFSTARTANLGIWGQLLLGAYVYLHDVFGAEGKKAWRKAIKHLLLVLVLFACVLFLFFFLFTTVKEAVAEALPSIQYYEGDNEAEETLKPSEIWRLFRQNFGKGLGTENEVEDAFTSGRKGIWAVFIEGLSFVGHEDAYLDIQSSGGRVYKDASAHNMYLQVGYSAGVLAGLALLFLVLWAGKDIALRFLRSLKGEPLDKNFVFASCIAFSFVMQSITSGGYTPFAYLPATYFWISLYVLTVKEK